MRKLIKGQQGFTLVETMVAAGLAGVVFLFATQFFNIVNKDSEKSKERLLTSLNTLQFEQIVRYDLGAAKTSFGLLNYKDDFDNNFFDYFFDAPCAASSCKRQVTLEVPAAEGNYSKPFYMLVTDNLFKKEIVYSPKEAYRANALAFESINYNNLLTNLDPSPWKKGGLVLLYSKYSVRKNSDLYDTEAPKLLGYLGWIKDLSSKVLEKEPIFDPATSTSYFRDTHPITGATIGNEDTFFRQSPYLEGLPSEIYLARVEVVRYRIQAVKEKGILHGKVLRGTKIYGGKFREIAIADKIKSLEFGRSNISTPQITINLKECDKKGLEEKRLCL